MTRDQIDAAILAYIANQPGTARAIAASIGLDPAPVRYRCTAMFKAGKLSRVIAGNNTHTYAAPVAADSPAPKPQYDVRVYGIEGNMRINRVSLPAQPPTQRLDAILQGINAQATQHASTGQNMGVSYDAE